MTEFQRHILCINVAFVHVYNVINSMGNTIILVTMWMPTSHAHAAFHTTMDRLCPCHLYI